MLQHEKLSLIGEAQGRASGEAVLIAGSDYELFTFDTPPVSEGELEVILSSRIRSLYPGNPETTVYESFPNAGSKKNHIVVVMQKEVLEAYRGKSKHFPLVIAPSILQDGFPRKGKWVGILWSPLAMESCLFEDSKLVSSAAYPHPEGTNASLSTIIKNESGDAAFVSVVVADNALQELLILQKVVAETGIPNTVARLSDHIKHFNASRKQLFSGKQDLKQRRRLTIARVFVPCVMMITGALILFRYGNFRENDLHDLEKQFTDRKVEMAKIASLKSKVRELEAGASSTTKHIPVAYEVLGAIANCLQVDCRITSFELSGSAFKFEAEASNSLSVLQSLEASDQLTAVTLYSASKISSGKEHLSISGSFNDAGH
jgi:hypothetical protein